MDNTELTVKDEMERWLVAQLAEATHQVEILKAELAILKIG